jgi:hypothetical protein
MKRYPLFFLMCVFITATPSPLFAQFDRGFGPYRYFDNFGFDSINTQNQNLVLHIPLLSYPQRGQMRNVSIFIGSNRGEWSYYYDTLNEGGGSLPLTAARALLCPLA